MEMKTMNKLEKQKEWLSVRDLTSTSQQKEIQSCDRIMERYAVLTSA